MCDQQPGGSVHECSAADAGGPLAAFVPLTPFFSSLSLSDLALMSFFVLVPLSLYRSPSSLRHHRLWSRWRRWSQHRDDHHPRWTNRYGRPTTVVLRSDRDDVGGDQGEDGSDWEPDGWNDHRRSERKVGRCRDRRMGGGCDGGGRGRGGDARLGLVSGLALVVRGTCEPRKRRVVVWAGPAFFRLVLPLRHFIWTISVSPFLFSTIFQGGLVLSCRIDSSPCLLSLNFASLCLHVLAPFCPLPTPLPKPTRSLNAYTSNTSFGEHPRFPLSPLLSLYASQGAWEFR